MERRKAIKNIGLSFGAFVATPTALSVLQSCGPAMEPCAPAFLSEDNGKLLRKLVDGILPGVDDLPSGTGANVHVFIDKYLDEVMPLECCQALSKLPKLKHLRIKHYQPLTREFMTNLKKSTPQKLESFHFQDFEPGALEYLLGKFKSLKSITHFKTSWLTDDTLNQVGRIVQDKCPNIKSYNILRADSPTVQKLI